METVCLHERSLLQKGECTEINKKKTRDAGFPAFFVPPSRPRGADEAKRRNAAEE